MQNSILIAFHIHPSLYYWTFTLYYRQNHTKIVQAVYISDTVKPCVTNTD